MIGWDEMASSLAREDLVGYYGKFFMERAGTGASAVKSLSPGVFKKCGCGTW